MSKNNLDIELHVPSFDVAEEFYSKLGFTRTWKRQEGDESDYLVMQRSGTIICFWPGNENVHSQSYFKQFPKNTKRGFGVEIVIPVENVLRLHKQIHESVNVVGDLVKRPWGLWDFRIEDPFGYYLRITEHHDITDDSFSVSTQD